MRQHTNNPGNNLSEDKKFQDQAKKVFAVFARRPSTMLMVSIETGILRANICRYVAAFQKEQALFIAFRGTCPISKHKAGFYSNRRDLKW